MESLFPEGICRVCKKDNAKKCSGCLRAFYCSIECQKIDWTDHKTRCCVLPLTYKKMDDKDVFWICDLDQDEKITSVFIGHGDKFVAYLPNVDKIKEQEKLLIDDGWVKVKKPEINFTFDAPKKSVRKEKRKLKN